MRLLIERIPFEAQNALRGEVKDFDELGASMTRLKSLTAGGASTRRDSSLDATMSQFAAAVSAVGDARAAVQTIQAANQETRELAPKLLSELGDLASAVGVQKLDGMSRHLERFELSVQRIQQEMNGLVLGVSDAAPTARRLADSLEFLNQVMRGLSGEESGLALSRVTGADAELRLKTVVQRNQQFGASVRKAIGAAEPLSKAQTAARSLPALASSMTAQIAAAPPAPVESRRELQTVDSGAPGAAAAAAGRPDVVVPQVGQCASHHRIACARERSQPGGHHAPAR